MATPEYIDTNYKVITEQVNASDIDTAQKMFYRQLLDKSKDSTNGRTQTEKIQDITEVVAGLTHLMISKHLDSKDSYKKLEDVSNDIDNIKTEVLEIKEDLEKNNEVTFKLDREHDCGGRFDFDSKIKQIEEAVNNKTKFDKIIDFLKNLPWSATVLGLGICALLAFKPEIVSIIKSLF